MDMHYAGEAQWVQRSMRPESPTGQNVFSMEEKVRRDRIDNDCDDTAIAMSQGRNLCTMKCSLCSNTLRETLWEL